MEGVAEPRGAADEGDEEESGGDRPASPPCPEYGGEERGDCEDGPRRRVVNGGESGDGVADGEPHGETACEQRGGDLGSPAPECAEESH